MEQSIQTILLLNMVVLIDPIRNQIYVLYLQLHHMLQFL